MNFKHKPSGAVPLISLAALALFLLLTPTRFAVSSAGGGQPAEFAAQQYPEKPPDDPFKARLIPRNSRIYIAPIQAEEPANLKSEGFEYYLAAALRKKNVPLIIVADRSQADFIIEGTSNQKDPGWAKKVILQDFRKSTSASMTVTNLKTGVIAYADSSDRSSANRGLRSSAEKLAKYLKRKIENDEKKS